MSFFTKSLLGIAAAAAIGTSAHAALVSITFYADPTSGAPNSSSNITLAQKNNAKTDDTAVAALGSANQSYSPDGMSGPPIPLDAGPRYVNTMTSYDLAVVINGDDWTSTDLSFHLSQGQFYNFTWANPDTTDPTSIQPDQRVIQTGLFSSSPNRHSRVDTAVTAPGFSAPNILGGFNSDGTTDQTTPTASFGPTDVHVSWGDLVTTSVPGTYIIGRFTTTSNAIGTGYGRVGGVSNQFSPTRFTVTIPVPEPVSAGLVTVGLGLLASRRNRKA